MFDWMRSALKERVEHAEACTQATEEAKKEMDERRKEAKLVKKEAIP